MARYNIAAFLETARRPLDSTSPSGTRPNKVQIGNNLMIAIGPSPTWGIGSNIPLAEVTAE